MSEPIPPEFTLTFEDGEKAEKNDAPALLSPVLPNLTEDERAIYSALGYEPTLVDHLVTSERRASEVMKILTKLEIKGLVRKVPGGKYVLADRAEA